MPIYEYKCKSCEKDFESLVMRQDEIPECPYCASKEVQRLMSSCGFISKGTGPSGETSISRSAGSSACAGCSATSCSSCTI